MPSSQSDDYPKGAERPTAKDTVQVLMTEELARHFERACLGRGNTVGDTYLAGPMLFSEGDLPTYTIGVRP